MGTIASFSLSRYDSLCILEYGGHGNEIVEIILGLEMNMT